MKAPQKITLMIKIYIFHNFSVVKSIQLLYKWPFEPVHIYVAN